MLILTFSDPRLDFARAIRQWYPTWPTKLEDRALIVYVLLPALVFWN